MRALVKTQRGAGNVALRDWPEPTIGPREVLIEVRACGICGTDVHIYHDTVSSDPPVVLGHELSGVVVEVGAEVVHVKVGDAVSAETHHGLCGVCRYCRTGFPRHCRARGFDMRVLYWKRNRLRPEEEAELRVEYRPTRSS